MNIDPNSLLIFARVAEAGSFSRAGERMGLPKSTVSRRVSALEVQLGERLLLRTTRKLSLTDFGHQLLKHARLVADEVDAAGSLALHHQAQPSGRLRVSMPTDPSGINLSRLVADFLARYPEVTLDLDLSARRVDLIGENFDLALRMGKLEEDSSLAARRVFEHSWGLYASPMYLALRGMPRTPTDLLKHDGLALRSRIGDPIPWTLMRQQDRWEGLAPPRATANSPETLMQLALMGAGIAAVPDRIVRPYLQDQADAALAGAGGVKGGKRIARATLVRVLPRWCLPRTPGWAVTPGRRLMPEKTRVFLEMLEQALNAP